MPMERQNCTSCRFPALSEKCILYSTGWKTWIGYRSLMGVSSHIKPFTPFGLWGMKLLRQLKNYLMFCIHVRTSCRWGCLGFYLFSPPFSWDCVTTLDHRSSWTFGTILVYEPNQISTASLSCCIVDIILIKKKRKGILLLHNPSWAMRSDSSNLLLKLARLRERREPREWEWVEYPYMGSPCRYL